MKSFGGESRGGKFVEASHRYSKGPRPHVASRAPLAQPITETIGTLIAVLLLWIGATRGSRGARVCKARRSSRS